MTNKEAKEKLYMEWQKFLEDNIDYAGISEAYKIAFKALEQEPCEDCISRKEVLSLPRKRTYDFMGGVDFSGVDVHLIKELPLVKPKERTAHWIHKGERFYTCSSCGGSAVIIKVDDLHKEYYMPYLTEWCPKCGARMAESEDQWN